MKLHSSIIGDNPTLPPLIVIHGLYGAGQNFRSLSKWLATHFEVHLIDLRNHGASPHSDEHSYAAMADDILEYLDEHGLAQAILLGHSMGGKVAMQVALNHPRRVSKLIVVDMAPKRYDPSIEHLSLFKALADVPLHSLESRQDADKILARHKIILPIRQFLLTNLVKTDHGFDWRINLPVLSEQYEKIIEPVNGQPYPGPTLFIRGERSNYIQDKDWPLIEECFPQAKLVTVAGAGHWVHAEQPEVVLQQVIEFSGDR